MLQTTARARGVSAARRPDEMTLHNHATFCHGRPTDAGRFSPDHARRKRPPRGGVTAVSPLIRRQARSETVPTSSPSTKRSKLGGIRPRQCDVVELRFFAGLTVEEVAEALAISRATVEREWAMAKAWLYERLSARSV